MSIFTDLRALVYLKRIAIALEKLAAGEPAPVSPKFVSLEFADTDTLDKSWRRQNPKYDGTDDFQPGA